MGYKLQIYQLIARFFNLNTWIYLYKSKYDIDVVSSFTYVAVMNMNNKINPNPVSTCRVYLFICMSWQHILSLINQPIHISYIVQLVIILSLNHTTLF